MKNLLILMLLMVFTLSGIAQTTVSGKVSEKDSNQPLVGVSVVIKGITRGTSTDFDGNYSLNDVGNDAV